MVKYSVFVLLLFISGCNISKKLNFISSPIICVDSCVKHIDGKVIDTCEDILFFSNRVNHKYIDCGETMHMNKNKFVNNADGMGNNDNNFSNDNKGIIKRTRLNVNKNIFIPLVDDINNEIGIGRVVYKIPDTMIILRNYDIIVRIMKKVNDSNKSDLNIHKNIGVKYVDTNIMITNRMEVDLVDSSPDSCFKICRVNSGIQLIDNSSYTEWIFTVRPMKHGKKELKLVISIIEDGDKKQIVYTDVVNVKDDIGKDIFIFWKSEWKWIFTTILIPIFVYFWKKRNKKNNDK